MRETNDDEVVAPQRDATTESSSVKMTRVTIIEDDDTTHDVESDYINVKETGNHMAVVVFQRGHIFPNSLRGMSASMLQGWEIVATDDGETLSGTISSAEGMRIRFNRGLQQPQQAPSFAP